MNTRRSLIAAAMVTALAVPLSSCRTHSAGDGALGAPPRSTVVRAGQAAESRNDQIDRELVEAALDELHGLNRECCFRVYVSLDAVLARCPDIAWAAEQERARRASRRMSVLPAQAEGPQQSFGCRTVLAEHGNVPRHPEECMTNLVQLDDIAVHFSVGEDSYHITLHAPYLCDGHVYGYVDAPVWGETSEG